LKGGAETARCLIIVTPDAQRSMNTYLGACTEFSETDVDESVIAQSAIIYLEGYLFDKDAAKRAYLKATKAAHKNDTKVALSLSDSFCVNRHRADFQSFIKNDVDILFANEDELMALHESTRFDLAVNALRGQCDIVAVTRSEKGSVIITSDQTIEIPAHPVSKIVDTTGAGDQYAAGFLFGLARGMDLAKCGALGSLAASEVISHVGPRPLVSLADLAKSILKAA
jgi:sugar/nucleoside kinase (ribokinase family)